MIDYITSFGDSKKLLLICRTATFIYLMYLVKWSWIRFSATGFGFLQYEFVTDLHHIDTTFFAITELFLTTLFWYFTTYIVLSFIVRKLVSWFNGHALQNFTNSFIELRMREDNITLKQDQLSYLQNEKIKSASYSQMLICLAIFSIFRISMIFIVFEKLHPSDFLPLLALVLGLIGYPFIYIYMLEIQKMLNKLSSSAKA